MLTCALSHGGCGKPIHPSQLPAVIRWGKKKEGEPEFLGRPIEIALHYEPCYREQKFASKKKAAPDPTAVRAKADLNKIKGAKAAARVPNKNLVAGRYKPGASMAILYEAMQDGEWHGEKELQKLITAKVTDRMHWLTVHGQETGQWEVHVKGSKYKLVVK